MKPTSTDMQYSTTLNTGKHWSLRIRRGMALQLTDETGGANVGMVLYNAENLLERYNAPDTLKCQHTFHLTAGHCLYSDMGHVLASIVESTADGHETVCGNSTHDSVSRRFGQRNYQIDRNAWHQNGNDAFLVELAKYGLNRRDLPANINWFSRCDIGAGGELSLTDPASSAGSRVTLRMEMDCLVLLHTCPHPMSRLTQYPAGTVGIKLFTAPAMQADDQCLNHCDENRRGFANNRLYHLGRA